MGSSKRRSTMLTFVLKSLFTASAIVATGLCAAVPAAAQTVGADPTVGTQVTPGTNRFTITGGTLEGTNLFHSFQDFSPQSWSAVFDLNNSSYAGSANSVRTIFSRVSGSSASNIDGLLQVVGGNSPDFFLLNPNGIVFGPNARLSLGGSFIGSTAESIRFVGDIEFAANSTEINPLLTMSVPTGLQMGAASRGIQVNDTGYIKLRDTPLTIDGSSSLQVAPNRTLGLIGSDITFVNGTVAAPGGRIEIGAVREGLVTISPNLAAFDYGNVQRFGDMQFSSQSLVNASDRLFGSTGMPYASGSQGGSIQIQGQNISFRDNSIALIQNFGSRSFGSLQVNASNTIELNGFDSSGTLGSNFITNNFGQGVGGNINVTAQQLLLVGNASFNSEAFRTATGGNITVAVSDTIRLEPSRDRTEAGAIKIATYGSGAAGSNSVSTRQLVITGGRISSRTAGLGNSGEVKVAADQVTIAQGGNISSTTLGAGNGSDVLVEANTIDISGIRADNFQPSIITAATLGNGNAGNVIVNAQRVVAREGGRIDSSTLTAGNAGSVTVTASESVEVTGTVPGSVNPSLITSSANIVDLALRTYLASIGFPGIPAAPSGAAGDVTINTPALRISNGAQATVRNDGSGDAGTLRVNANTVYLNGNAGITASTQQGGGGNLFLNARDVLLMRNGSSISAEARGIGDGGNISITSPAIIALENSDIVANAVRGNGGNISIDTQLLLGTQFREQLTAESDITASSEFGLSGTVSVEGFKDDPNSGLVELPAEVVDDSDQIASSCASSVGNRFVATGRGGLPPSPERSASDRPWNDLRDLSAFRNQPLERSVETTARTQDFPITEATAWALDERGQVALVAAVNNAEPTVPSMATCASRFDSATMSQG